MSQLLQLAEQHGAAKIITVRVTIGKLSGIVADSFSFGFEVLVTENNVTKDAVLEINETEPAHRCLDCRFLTDSPVKTCPVCHSSHLAPEGGDDLILTQVEME